MLETRLERVMEWSTPTSVPCIMAGSTTPPTHTPSKVDLKRRQSGSLDAAPSHPPKVGCLPIKRQR